MAVIDDVVFIQKSAEFTQGPVNGVFPSIPIVFRQTGPSTVTNIVIDDEIITNSTGVDWDDFHLNILNAGDALFNPAATADSHGPGPIGWTIAPFTEAAFTPDLLGLDIWAGTVPAGGLWFPGDGAFNGQLWIDVVSKENAPYTLFTLKEMPTIEIPPQRGTLTIWKFEDLNEDGIWDDGTESLLSGWDFNASGPENKNGTTTGDGYVVLDLEAGNYTVTELNIPPDWWCTTTNPLTDVPVVDTQNTDVFFGNIPEPGTMALVTLGGLVLVLRRRRRQ
jgi:hypothetical protein